MITLEIWQDKLPEDKAKYYNKTRMSIELFARKLGIAQQVIIKDLKDSGYGYNAEKRLFEHGLVSTCDIFGRPKLYPSRRGVQHLR